MRELPSPIYSICGCFWLRYTERAESTKMHYNSILAVSVCSWLATIVRLHSNRRLPIQLVSKDPKPNSRAYGGFNIAQTFTMVTAYIQRWRCAKSFPMQVWLRETIPVHFTCISRTGFHETAAILAYQWSLCFLHSRHFQQCNDSHSNLLFPPWICFNPIFNTNPRW